MEKNPLLVAHQTAADVARAPFDMVILPLGSLESHGAHLPFGTDALTAYSLALDVAARLPNAAVLPPVNYGMSEYYKDFSFTVSLQPDTETAIIRDILESVYREGIKKVFILNGHDGNIPSIEIASRCAKVAHPDLKIVSLDAWWNSLVPLLPPDFFSVWNGLGHGGEGELSMALALFPQLCRPELARGVVPALPEILDVKWKFSELTDCGATGDPTKASREKGERMRKVLTDAIVSTLKKMDADDWDYRSREVKKGAGDSY
ncbi:MAG: creatininase family protein [Methanoregula sp.]